jgi:hypothetical protein
MKITETIHLGNEDIREAILFKFDRISIPRLTDLAWKYCHASVMTTSG